jgi:hypothetical protein
MTTHIFRIANKLTSLNWGYDPTLCTTTVLGGTQFQITNTPNPNTIIINNDIPTSFTTVHIQLDNMTHTKFTGDDGFTMMIHYRPSLITDSSNVGDSWIWQRVFDFFTTGSVENDIYYTQLGESRNYRFSNFNQYNNQQKHSTSPIIDRTRDYILVFRNYPRFIEPSWGPGNNKIFDAQVDVYDVTTRQLHHSGLLYSLQYRLANGSELNQWTLGLSAYAADRRFRGIYYNFAGFTKTLDESQIGTVIRGFLGQEDIFSLPNPNKSLIIGPYIPRINLSTYSSGWLGKQYWRQNEGSDIRNYDISFTFTSELFANNDISANSTGIIYYPHALKSFTGINPEDTPLNGNILRINFSAWAQNPDNTIKILQNISGFILPTPAIKDEIVM